MWGHLIEIRGRCGGGRDRARCQEESERSAEIAWSEISRWPSRRVRLKKYPPSAAACVGWQKGKISRFWRGRRWGSEGRGVPGGAGAAWAFGRSREAEGGAVFGRGGRRIFKTGGAAARRSE